MLFEDIILLIIGGAGVFLIGVPCYKLLSKLLPPPKKNAVKEAKIRLEQAQLDLEAAKLNKQTERLYDELYEETLTEDKKEYK